MAVRDDPASRIKAVTAKHFMNLSGVQAEAQARIVLESYALKAILVLLFKGDMSPRLTCYSPDAKGLEVLEDWGVHFARIIPESIWRHKGAYVLGIHQDGVVDTATWGADEKACRVLGDWANFSAVHMTAAPFQTWFGFGTGGRPTALTSDELASLSEKAQQYVMRCTHPRAMHS